MSAFSLTKCREKDIFLALLEKDTDAPENYHAKRKPSMEKLPEELLEFLSHVTFPVQKQDIFIRDSKVYQVSPEMPQEADFGL